MKVEDTLTYKLSGGMNACVPFKLNSRVELDMDVVSRVKRDRWRSGSCAVTPTYPAQKDNGKRRGLHSHVEFKLRQLR